MKEFPESFAWGVAAAAYQIEGAFDQDGRGRSVWDDFCDREGAVAQGDTGKIACDHYHRFGEDVEIMRSLGVHAYRLSIAWPRILPEGIGRVNEAGLDFYDRLVDRLLEAGIRPWATLFHWDMPSTLFERGGWLDRESAAWMGEFAAVVAARLGDRVHDWITLNEPQVYIQHGHADGIHAPGLKLPLRDRLVAGHNTMRAHGHATRAIRASSPGPCRIGYTVVGCASCPVDDRPETIAAARESTNDIDPAHHFNNAWWLDPVCLGRYPVHGLELYGADAEGLDVESDLAEMHEPIDFLGLNIYQGGRVRAGADGRPEGVPHPVGGPITHFDWPVVPEALRWGPFFIHERYGLPVFITENGLASMDWVSRDGGVHDVNRIDFTARYLEQLSKAIEDGADVRGYFHWSILDNFEWAMGYTRRFGLVHVDYETQVRTVKDSARWYAEVIRTNGASID
ncbi:MAG: GH1 family beta-glucosidase [Planctomycetota bacterium]|nr:GH1 family beta-glucosidase [Planctomycetota bacterium]MEE2894989.1 GH1 family beta-glucosidase [Planctomycetota bacterium]